ncbi:MAG: sporulation protein YabP [Clostridia bacterium]|nr:sporulation protein YabP [Clostridia bacterium]MBQ8340450.1 sporulation protein YabP [Clostridia bacterium]
MAERVSEERAHSLVLEGRSGTVIEGVLEVHSFDEEAVILKTSCGDLTLEGEGLHVGALDIERGHVRIEGRINALYYSDAAPTRRGLRGRLFGG